MTGHNSADVIGLAGRTLCQARRWSRDRAERNGNSNDYPRLSRQTLPIRVETAPARAAPDQGLSRVVRWAHAAHPTGRLDLRARSGGWYADRVVELGGVSCAWSDGSHGGYSLCDALVEVRHGLARHLRGSDFRSGRARGATFPFRDGVLRGWLYDEPAGGGSAGRKGAGRLGVRRRAARARTRGAGAPPGAAPVFLEVRQVGTGPAFHGGQRARVLGGERVPQLW